MHYKTYSESTCCTGKHLDGETFKDSSDVYLVLAGMNEDSSYTEKLIKKAKDKNVNLKFIKINPTKIEKKKKKEKHAHTHTQ